MLTREPEEDGHLVEGGPQAPAEVCAAGLGVLEGPWAGGGHSGETICGPTSPACCHHRSPFTQRDRTLVTYGEWF